MNENVTKEKHSLLNILNDIKREILYKNGKNNSNLSLLKIIKFMQRVDQKYSAFKANDAGEFFIQFLDKLEEEFNQIIEEGKDENLTQKTDNLVKKFFRGKFKTAFVCRNCQNKKKSKEYFYVLNINFPFNSNYREVIKDKNSFSLEECLKELTNEEIIEEWFCNNCKEKSSLLRKTKIKKVPQFLFIQINRFIFNSNKIGKYGFMHKIDKKIIYKEVLEFKGNRFILKGVIVHKGSLNDGHYYCYVRKDSKIGKYSKWFLFNDEIVRMVSIDVVLNASFYNLIYEKTDK